MGNPDNDMFRLSTRISTESWWGKIELIGPTKLSSVIKPCHDKGSAIPYKATLSGHSVGAAYRNHTNSSSDCTELIEKGSKG